MDFRSETSDDMRGRSRFAPPGSPKNNARKSLQARNCIKSARRRIESNPIYRTLLLVLKFWDVETFGVACCELRQATNIQRFAH
ncbi:uncharacterized protein LOC9628758 isoform X2 [Selaginella moellendorffii]|uniref:uncharacterized protein LOC9628758 isoform X2 n=1 Tax=Selaginella moellendorffii TaxID=88036 RepID=UPI000D1C81D3|nr:uncharacterized protein LOC9628758 isoform X2 [Selaginella moellendorffii]|eukprot:XP_024535775.1 uncharacterized protein LOC9628758 isoform X2 [Selaginella moellendorffii]